MAVTDFKLSDDGDLSFFNGDFDTTSASREDADIQCIADMVEYNKGELKEFPFLGVGINSYLNSPSPSVILKARQEISLNLKSDGFKVLSLEGNNGLLAFSVNSVEFNINAVRNG